jgi:hypothetical protein
LAISHDLTKTLLLQSCWAADSDRQLRHRRSAYHELGWRWLKRRRASGWRTTRGYIETVEVTHPKEHFSRSRSAPYIAELSYSYLTAGGRNAGWYRRDFATEREAYEFVLNLKGTPDAVQVQAGMLTPAGDSAGIGLVLAAALMESETTQLAPAKAMQIALPAQLK